MNSTYLHRLSLAVFGLGALAMYGCAVQQPMASAQNDQPERTQSLSMFTAKRTRPVAAPIAEPAPQPLVAAEPAPEPQAAVEPAPEPQPQVVAEPAPKPRGPLTNAEENEIDTQVMP